MAKVIIDSVEKRFGQVVALHKLSLAIADGEFMTLVGPSGCGKSTLLRVIAGLEQQSAGGVQIGEIAVDKVRPSDRNLAMVFQSYALYPHLSVFDNIAVPLRMRRHGALQRIPLARWLLPGTWRVEKDIRKQVTETAESLGLGALLARKPGQLSGGQRQRVAVGRAIVRQPQAFLLDEPLSNLDAKMRVHMRTELSQLHRRLAATFIYVTHDQAEAMTMSDRIAVMMDGALIQVDTPDEVYHRPSDVRVAEFIGSPKINILPAQLGTDGALLIAGRPSDLCAAAKSGSGELGELNRIGVRPEACTLSAGDDPNAVLSGEISHVENFGAELFVQLRVNGVDEPLIARCEPDVASKRGVNIGDRCALRFDPRRILAFDASGQRVEAAVHYRDRQPRAVND